MHWYLMVCVQLKCHNFVTQVSIIACTSGGCTESPTKPVKTMPAVPRGLDPPILTPITERFVNVQWSPPKFPNGPGKLILSFRCRIYCRYHRIL